MASNPYVAIVAGVWLLLYAIVAVLLAPVGFFVATVPASPDTPQGTDAKATLPGVARVKDRSLELAPGVTFAQARAIAAKGYTLQDNTSPSDRDRWTLTYGSARLTLKGVELQEAGASAVSWHWRTFQASD